MQLGAAGDLGDSSGQQLRVLARRLAAARADLLRVAKLVLGDPGCRLEQDEVSLRFDGQHRERYGQGEQETQK